VVLIAKRSLNASYEHILIQEYVDYVYACIQVNTTTPAPTSDVYNYVSVTAT